MRALTPWLLLLTACVKAPPPATVADAEPPPPAADEPAEDPTELSDRMQSHYTFATAIVAAMVAGDFDEARKRAVTLAEMQAPPGLPITWRAGFASMRAHAATIADAPTDGELAQRAATLGRQCAACHTNLRPPEVTPSELAAMGWVPGSNRVPHAAASYAMWVGLFVPDTPTYRAGAEQLAGGALSLDALRELAGGELPAEVEDLGDTLAAVNETAVAASGPAERTAAFGRFLGACGTCHTSLGVTIPL